MTFKSIFKVFTKGKGGRILLSDYVLNVEFSFLLSAYGIVKIELDSFSTVLTLQGYGLANNVSDKNCL